MQYVCSNTGSRSSCAAPLCERHLLSFHTQPSGCDRYVACLRRSACSDVEASDAGWELLVTKLIDVLTQEGGLAV